MDRTAHPFPSILFPNVPMSIGDQLRSAREQAGLSVDDIIHATQMTRAQVEGLEADDYHAFSAPVYTKGFIKLFARAVGLPAEPLVKEYLSNPKGTEQHDPSREIPAVALEAANAESGSFERVRPEIPHVASARGAESAPAPEKKVAAAPAPGPAAHETTLLDFMGEETPAPEPAPAAGPPAEKRIAPVEPGVVPPEPPLKLVRFGDPEPKPAPAPVAKALPEPDAVGAPSAARADARPVVPEPIPLETAPFVFPGPRHVPAAVSQKPAAASGDADGLVEDKPARPPRTAELFPDDALAPAPDAPNAAKIFFANLADAAKRGWKRLRAAAAARRARPVWYAAAAVVAAAVLVSVVAGLLSGGGEVEPLPGDIVDPPPEAPVVDLPAGPVEIVQVLPAPRSFAK